MPPEVAAATEYAKVSEYNAALKYDIASKDDAVIPMGRYDNFEPDAIDKVTEPPTSCISFIIDETDAPKFFAGMVGDEFDSLAASAHDVLMVLKDTQLCAHSSYHGGDEKDYHRGANGHTRQVTCKNSECDKTVISARRRDASQLWRYLVQIALCTNWGRASRSRELFAKQETEHSMMISNELHYDLHVDIRIPRRPPPVHLTHLNRQTGSLLVEQPLPMTHLALDSQGSSEVVNLTFGCMAF